MTPKALSRETRTVIQGNCLEELPKINKQLNGKFIIVTDPPFNIGYHYNTYNDNLGDEEYYEMLQEVFQYGNFVVIHYPEKIVSWVYNSNTAKQHRDIAFFGIKPDFRKYGQDYKNPTDKRIMKRIAGGKRARLYDWWEINQVKNVSKDKTDHPCQMPLEVMKRIIGILPEDYTIVDPFAGSGTTALACKELGRKFIMIEQDEKYIEIINKRLTK